MANSFAEAQKRLGIERGGSFDQARSRLGIATPNARQVFFHNAAVDFVNAALGIPQATGELLATGAAIPQAILGPNTSFQQARERERQQWPASALLAIPRVNASDIQAAAQAGGIMGEPVSGETFGQRFQASKIGLQQRQRAMEQAHPIAAKLGTAAGDIASLAALRMPLAKRLTKPAIQVPLDPGWKSAVRRAFRFMGGPRVKRLAGRTAEVSLEGAVLAALHNQDPVGMAAFGAAGQLAGSAALGYAEAGFLQPLRRFGPVVGTGLALAGNAVAIGSIFQLAKTLTPGGKDYLLESLESGYEHIPHAIVAGLLAGMAGLGRLRGTAFARDLPKITDAINTMPRAAILSAAREFMNADVDGKKELEQGMHMMMTDPQRFFTPEQQRKLNKALRDSKTSILDTLRAFRK